MLAPLYYFGGMGDGSIPARNIAKYQIIKEFDVWVLFPKMTVSDKQHIMEENVRKIAYS